MTWTGLVTQPHVSGSVSATSKFVFVDITDDVGIADYVGVAQEVVRDRVAAPDGYRAGWAGQFQYFERARATLQLLVPATIFLIFFMLYMHRGLLTETFIIMLSLPFSLTGAVWLLWWLDYNLSVAVWVGMIAVSGLAVELGLLMMLYLDLAYRERARDAGNPLEEAIIDGASRRIRPMAMTGMALFMGLIPIMFSGGTAADVMKRVAAPMVGGIVSALLMVLVVFPAIFAIWRGRSAAERANGGV